MAEGPTSVSFERDIKPLFRDKDREQMQWAFDLWAYEDVKENAQSILAVVEDGGMPCDEPWPQDRVDFFRRWVEGGAAP